MSSQTHRALTRGGLILAMSFLLMAGLQAPVEAQSKADRGQVLAMRAQLFANEGRCDEAIPDLEQARKLRPDDASVALLLGQCRLGQRDYVAAHEIFEEANASDPELEDLDLYAGIALYHMGDFDLAWASLRVAQGNVSTLGEADLAFYTGLLQLERGDHRGAALSLERARSLNAEQVEPVASFYAGVAWHATGEPDLARENLERVIELDGETGPWGQRAADLLAGESLAARRWASASVGVEYDSNVALIGEAITLPATISNESDGRVVWAADVGAEIFRTRKWAGGVAGSYAGSAHFNLDQFNVHYPLGTVWLDREFTSRSFLRARYDVGYAWVGTMPYVLRNAASLGPHHNWGRAGNTEIRASWEWNEFQFDVSNLVGPGEPAALGPLRDRSGNGFGIGGLHRIYLPVVPELTANFVRRFELHGGYTYRRYWSRGTEWDLQRHELVAGFISELPWLLQFEAFGGVNVVPFDNPSTYPDPSTGVLNPDDRKDIVGIFTAELERPIWRWFSGSVRYQYLRNASNVTVFDYNRNIVGAYLSATY